MAAVRDYFQVEDDAGGRNWLFRAGDGEDLGPARGNCLSTQLDRPTLAAYCQAYARWVQAERALEAMAARDTVTGGLMIKTSNGNAIQNPLVGTANKAAADMVRFAAEFGMTPSSRSRLVFDPGAYGPSKFAGLLGPYRKPWETDDDGPRLSTSSSASSNVW